jgi:glutamate racemase
LIYYADQKYCPYGRRPPEEIRALSGRIVEFLAGQGCDVVVVACNTASAAALYFLRAAFPDITFVGMEPAVKPAASATRSGKIAVLATQGTLEGELFGRTRDEFAGAIQVITVYPDDWVGRVERGEIDTPETQASVRNIVERLLDAGVDEIALGCTHYPFLIPLLEDLTRGRATILDPSFAVAEQTARVVNARARSADSAPAPTFVTSGDPAAFERVLVKLLGVTHPKIQYNAL